MIIDALKKAIASIFFAFIALQCIPLTMILLAKIDRPWAKEMVAHSGIIHDWESWKNAWKYFLFEKPKEDGFVNYESESERHNVLRRDRH